VAKQVAALTLPVAINTDLRAPRQRHDRFPIGTVGRVTAYYAGDELHPDEERLLKLVLQTAHTAGSGHPVGLPGKMAVRWLMGEMSDANTQITREALLRLSSILVEFAWGHATTRSNAPFTRRLAMFHHVDLGEISRRSKQCSLIVCNLLPESAITDFMMTGRSPFRVEPHPTPEH
jgi:hypothetical protein